MDMRLEFTSTSLTRSLIPKHALLPSSIFFSDFRSRSHRYVGPPRTVQSERFHVEERVVPELQHLQRGQSFALPSSFSLFPTNQLERIAIEEVQRRRRLARVLIHSPDVQLA